MEHKLHWKAAKPSTDRVSKIYGSVKSRVKHVSQGAIRSKWRVLNRDTQAKVEDILLSVELPALARHTSEQRKIEAQRALGSITRTLVVRACYETFIGITY